VARFASRLPSVVAIGEISEPINPVRLGSIAKSIGMSALSQKALIVEMAFFMIWEAVTLLSKYGSGRSDVKILTERKATILMMLALIISHFNFWS